MKKTMQHAVLTLFTLLACWGVAELALYVSMGQELADFRTQAIADKKAALAVLNADEEKVGVQTYTYHPYYGYVFSGSQNNASDVYKIDGNGYRGLADYRRRPEGTKLVGVFGGSAVMGWQLQDRETLAGQLQRLLDANVPGRYLVKNFGIGAWHLPQHLFAFIREVEFLDYVVFFDGSNELYLGTEQAMGSAYPLDFPIYDARHFMHIALQPEIRESFLRLARARAAFPSDSLLAKSRVFLFFSRFRTQRLEMENRQLIKNAEAMKEIGLPERRGDKPGYDEAVNMALASYRKYSLIADAVADKCGVPLLHVLQPMLTAEFTPSGMAKELGMTEEELFKKYMRTYFEYPRLRRLYHDLWGGQDGSLGARALDLSTAAPRDIACERYWFDVVHLRKEGMAIVAEKVFRKALDAGWFPRARDLTGLELRDDDNAGRVRARLNAADLLGDVPSGAEFEWQLPGGAKARGKEVALELPVGESIVFLAVSAPGRVEYFRLAVRVHDNLSVLKNLALNARASSNDPSSNPALAVDGRTGGASLAEVWWSTRQSRELYWQADLGAPARVQAVEVFFREDFREAPQVSNLVVLGANRADFSDAEVIGRRGREPFPEDRRWVSYVPGGPYRYLRVARQDDDYLVLAEVLALGRPEDGTQQ